MLRDRDGAFQNNKYLNATTADKAFFIKICFTLTTTRTFYNFPWKMLSVVYSRNVQGHKVLHSNENYNKKTCNIIFIYRKSPGGLFNFGPSGGGRIY